VYKALYENIDRIVSVLGISAVSLSPLPKFFSLILCGFRGITLELILKKYESIIWIKEEYEKIYNKRNSHKSSELHLIHTYNNDRHPITKTFTTL
jgi:hypothetical protein